MISRDDALRLDHADPLAPYRHEFLIPDQDVVYLDGNSLGRTPLATIERLKRVVETEWATDLIASWSHWLDMPRKVGDRMSAIIGSRPGEVAVHDNTTLNIFQAVHMALSLRPDRRVVSVSSHDFPSDRYVVEGIARDLRLEMRPFTDDMHLDDVAVVVQIGRAHV